MYTCYKGYLGLFSRKSGSEKGTLFQIKHLLYRTSVPEDNMNAAEDFMEVVLEVYVVAAANEPMQSWKFN